MIAANFYMITILPSSRNRVFLQPPFAKEDLGKWETSNSHGREFHPWTNPTEHVNSNAILVWLEDLDTHLWHIQTLLAVDPTQRSAAETQDPFAGWMEDGTASSINPSVPF